MKVLIAEDSVSSRVMLATILKKWGYEVIATSNGKEAWDELKKPDAPKLAILDWMMPEMDGLDVCKKVRKMKLDNPPYVILLTALGSKEHIVKGLDAGADDYIGKPFDNNELRARLQVGQRVVKLQTALARRVTELQEALEHIKTLQGILPICMHCHKIRTDSEAWERVDAYIEKHTDAHFSHSLCPECLEKYYPEEEEIHTAG